MTLTFLVPQELPRAAVDCAAMTAVIALIVGFGGVGLGALLARRNEKRSRSERLLTQALNDGAAAIAEIAAGGGADAQAHYASASARIALHGPPEVVEPWRRFQDEGTTNTEEGRARLVVAVQAARKALRHKMVSDADLRVLLFGSDRPGAGL
jgi:hypothetical protein